MNQGGLPDAEPRGGGPSCYGRMGEGNGRLGTRIVGGSAHRMESPGKQRGTDFRGAVGGVEFSVARVACTRECGKHITPPWRSAPLHRETVMKDQVRRGQFRCGAADCDGQMSLHEPPLEAWEFAGLPCAITEQGGWTGMAQVSEMGMMEQGEPKKVGVVFKADDA